MFDEVFVRQELERIISHRHFCWLKKEGRCTCGSEGQRQAVFELIERLVLDAKKEN